MGTLFAVAVDTAPRNDRFLKKICYSQKRSKLPKKVHFFPLPSKKSKKVRFFCPRQLKYAAICDASFPRHTDQFFGFFGGRKIAKKSTFFGTFLGPPESTFFGLRTESCQIQDLARTTDLASFVDSGRSCMVLAKVAKKSIFCIFRTFSRFCRFL